MHNALEKTRTVLDSAGACSSAKAVSVCAGVQADLDGLTLISGVGDFFLIDMFYLVDATTIDTHDDRMNLMNND